MTRIRSITPAERAARDRRIVAMKARGLTINAIAARIGLNANHVSLILLRAARDGDTAAASPPRPDVPGAGEKAALAAPVRPAAAAVAAESFAETVERLTLKRVPLTGIAAVTRRPYREIAAMQARLGLAAPLHERTGA